MEIETSVQVISNGLWLRDNIHVILFKQLNMHRNQLQTKNPS